MAHKVTFTLPDRELGKADIEFLVKSNNEVVGKLLVSKGSVVWRSKNKQIGKKLGWKNFDQLMLEHGNEE